MPQEAQIQSGLGLRPHLRSNKKIAIPQSKTHDSEHHFFVQCIIAGSFFARFRIADKFSQDGCYAVDDSRYEFASGDFVGADNKALCIILKISSVTAFHIQSM
ncbi:2424_t:CDS:2 [Ambispora gerdemannii]|uniref:2424_t:CDS:1 n=1 Tax=Ambispora gerdemannii TaxID=144530 RepID=A0A9N9H6F8_9GLOM|nr:2424_t:CDS:2 [Ambispora gerdemannii]